MQKICSQYQSVYGESPGSRPGVVATSDCWKSLRFTKLSHEVRKDMACVAKLSLVLRGVLVDAINRGVCGTYRAHRRVALAGLAS
jgi:hypothetical protein